jgi:hypothetical protein
MKLHWRHTVRVLHRNRDAICGGWGIYFLFACALLGMAAGKVHAAPEQVEILSVQQSKDKLCSSLTVTSPHGTPDKDGKPSMPATPRESKFCNDVPVYVVSYRRNNGTMGAVNMKSYPTGKTTVVNFCGIDPCK